MPVFEKSVGIAFVEEVPVLPGGKMHDCMIRGVFKKAYRVSDWNFSALNSGTNLEACSSNFFLSSSFNSGLGSECLYWPTAAIRYDLQSKMRQ